VTAYKSLKLAMNKNLKGIEKGREVCAGKGYLKPTIASRQAKRVTLGYAPLTMSTQHYPESGAAFTAVRGSTAPAGAQRKLFTAQSQSRGLARPHGTATGFGQDLKYSGTLQDYSGGAWGATPSAQTRASTRGRTAGTAPVWRKTKQQRVDEKVNKLLASYNEATRPALALSEQQRRAQLTAKYFPGKDVPLTQKDYKSETGSNLHN
jgi:hypothetical protein